MGSYTSSPPSEPHREGGGAEGGIVFYSIRAEEDTLFEVLDDTLNVVGVVRNGRFFSTIGLIDRIRANATVELFDKPRKNTSWQRAPL